MDESVVRKAPLFAALDDQTTAALLANVSRVRLARGEVLFQEGEVGDRLYVIVEGKVKLGRRSPDGRENLVAVLGPGELLGELSLFDPGPRTTSATAVGPTRMVALGNDDLHKILDNNPKVGAALLASLARRLRRTNDVLSDLIFTDVPGRVAKALIDLAERFGRRNESGILVPHDLTQEELAQLVGASRETVNKALADFAQRGWVRLEARAVTIIDIERLARRSR